jgi:general secretion pathway protein K
MAMNRSRAAHRQQGLALITAVLIVAIIAGVATTLGLGQQVWLRQTENLLERAQADSLRYSALGWVAMLLTRDANDNQVDHLGELWAKQLPPLPTEGGMIAVSIRDAQGLFNLNNLLRTGAPSGTDIGMFRRLLTAQGLDPAITEALLDWMDPDSDQRPGGAEDIDYLARPTPYRAANQPLTSIDELRLIKGFTPAVVEKLRPLVTVLPESSALNVNTAIEPVLAALFPNPPGALLPPILAGRESQPFKDPGQFLQQLPPGTAPPQAAYDIKTSYFLVTIGIRIGRLDRRAEALIARPQGRPASVLWHRLNPIQPQTKTDEQA